MRHLSSILNLLLILMANNLSMIKWWVDEAFVVHNNCWAYIGAAMTIGSGCIIRTSKKLKLNARSSTESELIGIDDDDDDGKVLLWTRYFMEAQGCPIEECIVYQDNNQSIGHSVRGYASRAEFLWLETLIIDLHKTGSPTFGKTLSLFRLPTQIWTKPILCCSYWGLQNPLHGGVVSRPHTFFIHVRVWLPPLFCCTFYPLLSGGDKSLGAALVLFISQRQQL